MTAGSRACARLVVLRLSDTRGREDIGHVLRRTYQGLPDGIRSRLLSVAADPLDHPDRYGADRDTGPMDASVVGFWADPADTSPDTGTYVLMFLASATLTGTGRGVRSRQRRGPGGLNLDTAIAESSNWFTEYVTDVMAEKRPRELHVSNVNRAVRSLSFLGVMYEAFSRYAERLVIDGAPFDPRSRDGSVKIIIDGLFAALDRDQLVQNQANGKMSRVIDNEWVWGTRAVPLGWRPPVAGGQLQVDEAARPVVALLVRAACGYGRGEVAALVARIGLTKPGGNELRRWVWDPGAVAAEHAALGLDMPPAPPPAAVTRPGDRPFPDSETVWRWLSRQLRLWSGEQYTVEWTLPTRTTVGVQGLDTVTNKDGDVAVVLPVEMPQPDPPWADPGLLAEAAAEAARRAEGGRELGDRIRAGKTDCLPLIGPVSRWTRNGREYALIAGLGTFGAVRERCYDLKSRPASDRPRAWSSYHHRDGLLEARMRAGELHAALSRAVIDALTAGVVARRGAFDDFRPLVLDPARPVRRRPSDRLPEMRAEHARLEAESDLAMDASRRAAGEKTRATKAAQADDLAARADRLAERIRAVEAEARAAGAPAPEAAPAPITLRSELELMVHVIAELGRAYKTPTAFAAGLEGFMRLRVVSVAGEEAAFEADVAVLDDSGAPRTLTGARGTVPNRYPRLRVDRSDGDADAVFHGVARARSDQAMEAIFEGGQELGDWAWTDVPADPARPDAPPRAWDRTLRSRIVDDATALAAANGVPLTRVQALVLLKCPVPETKAAVWAALNRRPAPPGADAAFAAHCARSHLGPNAVPDWAPPSQVLRRPHGNSDWYYNDRHGAALVRWAAGRGTVPRDEALAWLERRGRTTFVFPRGRAPGPVPVMMRHRGLLPGSEAAGPQELVSVRPCPFDRCDGGLDRLVQTPETACLVLCSSCRRMPHPASPVFPQAYLDLDLTYEAFRARMRLGGGSRPAWPAGPGADAEEAS